MGAFRVYHIFEWWKHKTNQIFKSKTSEKLTRPIFSTSSTSSLFNSHLSLKTGDFNTAPERLVTGNPEWNWYKISSCTDGNDGPSNLNLPWK